MKQAGWAGHYTLLDTCNKQIPFSQHLFYYKRSSSYKNSNIKCSQCADADLITRSPTKLVQCKGFDGRVDISADLTGL